MARLASANNHCTTRAEAIWVTTAGAHRLEARRPPYCLTCIEGNHLMPAHERGGRGCPTTVSFGDRPSKRFQRLAPNKLEHLPTNLRCQRRRSRRDFAPTRQSSNASSPRAQDLQEVELPLFIPTPPYRMDLLHVMQTHNSF
jgi:hypothetical protein